MGDLCLMEMPSTGAGKGPAPQSWQPMLFFHRGSNGGQSIQYPGLGHTGMDLLQGYGKLSGSSGQLFSHYFFLIHLITTYT